MRHRRISSVGFTRPIHAVSAAVNDMDQYADDLAELADSLDLHQAILVGHSTGRSPLSWL